MLQGAHQSAANPNSYVKVNLHLRCSKRTNIMCYAFFREKKKLKNYKLPPTNHPKPPTTENLEKPKKTLENPRKTLEKTVENLKKSPKPTLPFHLRVWHPFRRQQWLLGAAYGLFGPTAEPLAEVSHVGLAQVEPFGGGLRCFFLFFWLGWWAYNIYVIIVCLFFGGKKMWGLSCCVYCFLVRFCCFRSSNLGDCVNKKLGS